MPPNLDLSKNNTQEARMQASIENLRFSLISGVIMAAVFQALLADDTLELKLILSFLGAENPEELIAAEIKGMQPFRDFKPHNIVRFPDEVREKSLLDDTTETLDGECPCEVSFFRGQVYVRWTLPRPKYILRCNSPKKLAHLGMVVVEELLHIRQILSPNTRAVNTLSTFYEFDAVPSIGHMEQQDQELLAAVLETDITLFFEKYFAGLEDLQWFNDRHNADDYHKTLSPQAFIDAIMYLSQRYGYIEEVIEYIVGDIHSAIESNPDVGVPMLLAPSLYQYVDHATLLEQVLEIVAANQHILANDAHAAVIAEVFNRLANANKASRSEQPGFDLPASSETPGIESDNIPPIES